MLRYYMKRLRDLALGAVHKLARPTGGPQASQTAGDLPQEHDPAERRSSPPSQKEIREHRPSGRLGTDRHH